MKITNTKKMAGAALLTIGSVALVGAGTGASVFDKANAEFEVKAGTADLQFIAEKSPGFEITQNGDRATLNFNGPVKMGTNGWDGVQLTVVNKGDMEVPLKVVGSGDGALPVNVVATIPEAGKTLAPGEETMVTIDVNGTHDGEFINDDSGKVTTVTVEFDATI